MDFTRGLLSGIGGSSEAYTNSIKKQEEFNYDQMKNIIQMNRVTSLAKRKEEHQLKLLKKQNEYNVEAADVRQSRIMDLQDRRNKGLLDVAKVQATTSEKAVTPIDISKQFDKVKKTFLDQFADEEGSPNETAEILMDDMGITNFSKFIDKITKNKMQELGLFPRPSSPNEGKYTVIADADMPEFAKDLKNKKASAIKTFNHISPEQQKEVMLLLDTDTGTDKGSSSIFDMSGSAFEEGFQNFFDRLFHTE